MQVGYKTDQGKKRQNNEDSLYVKDNLYIVADGVGGGNFGEVASKMAVDIISQYFDSKKVFLLKESEKIISSFDSSLLKANEMIFSEAIKSKENIGMATTLVLFYVVNKIAYIANVGDSRLYIYRDNSLLQLTEDHTYVNKLVRAGVLTKAQAENDSRRNMITKALGAEPKIEPDYFKIEILKDDIFILCTDGLYDEVTDKEIVDCINSSYDMNNLCDNLILRANNNGGHDNITVVCAKVMEDDLNE